MGIILASGSPRRRELLTMLGLDFRVEPSETEITPVGLPPGETAAETAKSKAEEAAARFKNDLIIAADTIVYIDGKILGKPRDAGEAHGFLRQLSGKTHGVYTGVCVINGTRKAVHSELTHVKFREIQDAEISRYIATGEPMDKAGAYGAQGRGALFIKGIDGDFFNVMGLPLCALGELLREFGVLL